MEHSLSYGLFMEFLSNGRKTKNIGYNILDLLSKCFVGLSFGHILQNISL